MKFYIAIEYDEAADPVEPEDVAVMTNKMSPNVQDAIVYDNFSAMLADWIDSKGSMYLVKEIPF